MTNKEMLQKRIDALCEELGINEPQYTDKTTEKQLNGIIDELEAKLPDEGDENDDIDSTIEHNLDADSSEETTEGNATTGKVPSEKNVLVMAGDLHEDVALINDDEAVDVVSDESGDILVFALKTFECISHGRRITVKQGGEEYLEEQAAIDAIEANVADFRSQLKG